MIGYSEEEIDTSLITRAARLKWIVAVDSSLPAGRQVNAAVCIAAATSAQVSGLLARDVPDGDGVAHPGLPWAGVTVLTGTREQLLALAGKARSSEGVFVADMPEAAQLTRVYDEYEALLGTQSDDEVRPLALSIVGPRNRVDRITKGLPLL